MNLFVLHPSTSHRAFCDSRQLRVETAGLLQTPFSRQKLRHNQSMKPAAAEPHCPQRRWMAGFLAMRLANGRPAWLEAHAASNRAARASSGHCVSDQVQRLRGRARRAVRR